MNRPLNRYSSFSRWQARAMQRLLTIAVLGGLFAACSESAPAIPAYPDAPLAEGAAHAIRLRPGSQEVVLADWFGPDFTPDSVTYPSGIMGRSAAGNLGLTTGKNVPPVSVIQVWKAGFPYAIPVFKSGLQAVQINYQPDPSQAPPGQVQVAGVFNDWNPGGTFMAREQGVWKSTLHLSPGQYQYQLVVDGKWGLDPANPDSMDNNVGGYNSVLRVERPANLPRLKPAKTAQGIIEVSIEGHSDNWLVLWNYAELGTEWVQRTPEGLRIVLPAQARQAKNSVLTLLAWNAEGRSNDLRIPLQAGQVPRSVPHGRDLPPQAQTLYFPLVDRFANGDQSNDRPTEDARILPPANFFGGDLQGLTQHLDYIQDLGCNTVWISPVARNPEGAYQEYPEPRRWFSAYHGYWPTSYREVDPRFGGDAALEDLVDQAHARGMRVLLDFVANHVHQEHPMMAAHPDWSTQLDLPDGRRNLRLWDEQRLTTWFDDFLPSLDFSRPEVLETVTDSALYWIERFDLDGFRHDATKHIPVAFWRTLTAKLKANFPDRHVYQIGETFGSRELIASYLGPGLLDAQFDFPLYFATRSVLTSADGDFRNLAEELQASLDAFGHHHSMGNITGNHDMARFATLAGGGLLPGEDAKEAGWHREVGIGDPVAYQMAGILMGFNAAIPGAPVIYYGDEIGMPGGGDPDSRRMMRFDNWSAEESALHDQVKALMQNRLEKPALVYGSTQLIHAEKDALVLERSWFGSSVWVGLNKANTTLTVPVSANQNWDLAPGVSILEGPTFAEAK